MDSIWKFQKHLPEVFYKKSVLRKITVLESLFNKVAGLKTCNFIKKRLQRRCFLVKFAKCLRTSFLKKICERLLLIMIKKCLNKMNQEQHQYILKLTFPKIKKTYVNSRPTGYSLQSYRRKSKVLHFSMRIHSLLRLFKKLQYNIYFQMLRIMKKNFQRIQNVFLKANAKISWKGLQKIELNNWRKIKI